MRAGAFAVVVAMLVPLAAHAGELRLRDAAAAAPLTPSMPASALHASFEDGPAATGAPISATRAVLYSLLLPGLGDYMLGNRNRAVSFFAVEGGIWISYGVFKVQGHQREEDYQQLAVQFAGVSRTGHSDEFYATLREYENSTDYEADVKNNGRFDLGRALTNAELETYFIENRLPDYEPWQWQSLDRRLQYSEVRSASKTSYRRANYMLAAAAANRVVSAIFAYAGARSAASRHDLGYRIDVSPGDTGLIVALTLSRSF